MRSQLAWHLFNTGPFSAFPSGTDVARLACYGITMSPRFDGLVVISDAHENVPDCFFFGQHRPAFPGLRLARSARWHTYEAVHLPAGGKLTVTKDRLNRPIRDEDHEHQRGPSPEVALDDWELTALEHIPHATRDQEDTGWDRRSVHGLSAGQQLGNGNLVSATKRTVRL
jgi:hypothetical protein